MYKGWRRIAVDSEVVLALMFGHALQVPSRPAKKRGAHTEQPREPMAYPSLQLAMPRDMFQPLHLVEGGAQASTTGDVSSVDQYPAMGQALAPPGQRAPAGQGEQSALEPNMQEGNWGSLEFKQAEV
jgi:hypothetical protein